MYGYIYEVTNLINGKKYIGQKKSDRFLGNSYLGRGKLIKQAHLKYGKANFTSKLLKECQTKDELNYYEKYYIKYYNAVESNKYYNLGRGGEGGNTIDYMTLDQLNEYKQKVSNSLKGRILINKENVEKHIKPEELEYYLSNGFSIGRRSGIYVSEKFKKAQRNRNLGRKRSNETKKKMSESFKGRKYSDKTKQRMSEAAKNRPHTYWINKNGLNKKVQESELDFYINSGWTRGRYFIPFNKGKHLSNETKKKISKTLKNK